MGTPLGSLKVKKKREYYYFAFCSDISDIRQIVYLNLKVIFVLNLEFCNPQAFTKLLNNQSGTGLHIGPNIFF